MRRNQYIHDEKRNISTYMLYSFDYIDFNLRKQVLLDVININNVNELFVLTTALHRDGLFDNFSKFCLESKITVTGKQYNQIALKTDLSTLNELIEFSLLNSERTEIYIVDRMTWNEFMESRNQLKENNYELCLTINDNNTNYIRVNLNKDYLRDINKKMKHMLSV